MYATNAQKLAHLRVFQSIRGMLHIFLTCKEVHIFLQCTKYEERRGDRLVVISQQGRN